MKEYENTEINNLVYPCNTYGYNVQFTDGYGNKTKYLKIDAKQLEQIKNIITTLPGYQSKYCIE